MATKNDVLKVQVQLSNIQLLQMDAANTILLTSYSLNSLLGVPLSTELQPIETAIFQPTEISSLENLVQDALLYRPEIKNMDLRIKSSDAGVTLAKSGWYPQVFLSGNYNYARPNQRIFPTQDEFKNTWDVSLGVSFDVWNWNTTSYQTTQAEALQSQAQFGMQQLKDGIILEVTQHYLNNKQAQEKIAVAEQGKLQAEENYRTSSEKFRNGLLQNSELLDAEVLLLQSKTNYTQALIDYQIAKAQLTRATGK
jgi:outer membrane protein TolC